MELRGAIIPVIRAVKACGTGQTLDIPRHCPSCGAATESSPTHVRCPSEHCPAVLEQALLLWAQSRRIPGLGPQLIRALVAEGRVKRVSDL